MIAAGYSPNNSIVEDLKKSFKEVYTVGDANIPRRIIDAVEEGYLSAIAI